MISRAYLFIKEEDNCFDDGNTIGALMQNTSRECSLGHDYAVYGSRGKQWETMAKNGPASRDQSPFTSGNSESG